MALRISRLHIKNFRNFADCEIDPFPAPAVIVGENGVGKSNMLHALRLVLDPDLPDSARRLRAEDIHDGATGPLGKGLPGGAEVFIEVELSGFDDDEEAVAILSGALVDVSRPKRARLTYRFAPRDRPEVDPDTDGVGDRSSADSAAYTRAEYDFELTQGGDAASDAGRVRRYVSLRVLPALRDAEGDLARWNRSPLRTLLEELNLDTHRLKEVAADIDAAADKLAKEPQIGDMQKSLANRLKALVGPQLPVDPTVGIASTDPDSLLRGLRLFVDAARSRTVADTSLGAANVLYLGMLMEALAVQRAASAFAGTILGVEEPEAHLHVSIQRRLFRHLLATEPALILTTHSPHIAAVAPLESLLLLREVGTETVASSTLNTGLDELERADISRYLDVSRAELLFARYVLLVEGTAETFLLPAIAEAAGFDMDEYGVVIVNVVGTDFAPYRKLLGAEGLNLPSAVLTDGDPLRNSVDSAEQGFTRAAAVLLDDSLSERVDNGAVDLARLEKEGKRDEAADLRRELQDACAAEDVFVGDHTLELDLLPLLGDELVAAFAELSGRKKSANMARDVTAILYADDLEGALSSATAELAEKAGQEPSDRSSDEHRRTRVLDRIEDVGKGRFAQRWASHIAKVDLRAGLLRLLEISGLEIEEDIDNGTEPVTGELIEEAGSVRACLRVLEWASQQARGGPLLAATAVQDDL
ncbi:ATP-dependent nuclease [Rhodococcus sp. A5(2022)]|uniref:ATP-dependent nuclease n=1 Tax=Rhodococcus sp. A5(2022) TaxID=3003588 RepID=UPI0022A85E7A|nr:AAA family ATPase [Rhodococcus sp. A5(2022)]